MKSRFMRVMLVVVCTGLLVSESAAATELITSNSATPAVDQNAELQSICAETYCRKPRTIKLLREDGSAFETQTQTPLPIVQNGMVSIMPEETIFLEAEEEGDLLKNIRVVESVTQTEKTIVMQFKQVTTGKAAPFMLLKVSNPFLSDIKYHVRMMPIDSDQLHKTSSCPVQAKLSVFESWPHPIFQLIISDFRLLPPQDPKVGGSCEY